MMKKIIAYKRYFSDFILTLSQEERGKIKRALDLFKVEERMPRHYIKFIRDGFYEFRVSYGDNDIYDIDAWLDESLGKEGTPEREKNRERAWEEYNAQILLDARKNAGLTQQELADRIGANKGYISRIERGLTVPTVATLYKIASAMGLTIELRPI